MDKNARNKFWAVKEEQRQKQFGVGKCTEVTNDRDTKLPPSTTGFKTDNEQQTIAAGSTNIINEVIENPEVLIREALKAANIELIHNRDKKPMTAKRKALIEKAMAIHTAKSHILDSLDPKTREKLTFIAIKALDKNLRE